MRALSLVLLLPILAACATDPATKWACGQMRHDQSIRDTCLHTENCQLSAADMRKHVDTQAKLDRYCK